MTIMFVNQDDPGHSITVKLTKTTAILTRSTNIDGLATSQVKHFLLRETVPYTRKDRKTGEPIIASYAAGEHSQRTHLEKVEAKAAQSGAKWGAIWGASLGLVGGLVSTWLAFRFGWTK